MLRNLVVAVLCCAALVSCSDSNIDSVEGSERKAKGSAIYGGDFKFMSQEKIGALFSPSVDNAYTMRVASQIHQSLLRVADGTTNLEPCIAESYTISDDATEFTLTIRKGIYFHDDACFAGGKGREVKASDIEYLFDFVCSSDEKNKYGWLFLDKIKGAKEYYETGKDGVSGVEVVDDNTIKIKLTKPEVAFEKYLAHTSLNLFAKESIEKYGDDVINHPVGTGPYTLDSKTADKVVLKRNPNYWEKDDFGNQLPFIETITTTYSKDKEEELIAFRNQEIDLVTGIPVDQIENMLTSLKEAGKNVKHKIDSKNSLSIEYYGFSHTKGVFADKNVRLAFNKAINRTAIVETLLKGEGWPANGGFVPDMTEYPSESIKGYSYDVLAAQKLMSKAGYKNGKGFPKINLYLNAVEGDSKYNLAQGVSQALKANLNVSVEIVLTTIEEREASVNSGDAIFWRTGWIADIADPEDFLNLFYGGNAITENVGMEVNPFGYKSEAFDKLFDKARTEQDSKKRMEMLAECDQMIIDDAVVMPLVSDDFVTMINARVRKFQTNEMENINFSRIFIKELKK